MDEKEEYTIRIGKLLKEAIERQKEKIKDVTYDCVSPSDLEAGEVLAKKIISSKLI